MSTTTKTRTWAQQKAGLTRAINSKNLDTLITECRRTLVEWAELPYGWPDDWHRWNIALEDAFNRARADYVRGISTARPHYCTLDDLEQERRMAAYNAHHANQLASVAEDAEDL